jgi:hypothetical protein
MRKRIAALVVVCGAFLTFARQGPALYRADDAASGDDDAEIAARGLDE